MASAAEQLAANINFANFSKATELKKRIWFTLGALFIFRLGTYVPLPGIDPSLFEQKFLGNSQGMLELFNSFSGGAVQRSSIFMLGIVPYISASIIVQLVTPLFPALEALKKEGDSGRKLINQYTRYLTVLLGAGQAYGIAAGLQASSDHFVINPGMAFIVSAVLTLVGGTVFLMWLGEQITARGIGNGSSLIIFAGIISGIPGAIVNTLRGASSFSLSPAVVFIIPVMVMAVVAFIVFVERAQRRLLITYPKRQVGNRVSEQQTSFLPLKLNTSGVIPPIFASSLLLLPTTIARFVSGGGTTGILGTINAYMGQGSFVYLTLYVLLIVFFAFYYTAQVFNPVETADNLKKHGGFIPGVRPGERTAQLIDKVLTRITVLGAIYLSIICLLPQLLISKLNLPFYFGGTSLLIVVSVTMDTVAQIHGHLQAQQYEGLIKKAKLKGRKK
ncbi:MAG: preprotein translocase subunit SecY [Hyphomicrobiales bacterium]|nr:preprotein translocase subunit SecY [Hyphomicrobiales bacterium]MDE2113276.1 preprotein translocase subunit SecY [Hyphomicrobiales bacterium]